MKKVVPFLLATLVSAGGLVRSASAQEPSVFMPEFSVPFAEAIASPQKPRSFQENIDAFDVSTVDVREALRELFRKVGTSYSIAPDVQGTVTLSVRNVTFENTLKYLMRQVNAGYRIEGGVVNIVTRPADAPIELPPNVVRISAFSAVPTLAFDKAHVFVVFEDRILKLRKDDLSEVDQNDRRPNSSFGPDRQISQAEYDRVQARRFDVDFKERALPVVLDELSRLAKIPIRVEPNVRGVVTMNFQQVTLEHILAEIDKQVRTRHGFFRGRLHIGSDGIRFTSGPDRTALIVVSENPAKNFSAVDGDFLYICTATKIEKVRKSDLTRVAEVTFSTRRF